jgi:hypothetical protein
MLRILKMMAAAVMFSGASIASAQAGAPAAGWTVAEADGACTMRHGLEGVQGGVLEVRTYAGTGQYQLRLVSQDWRWEPRNGEDMVSLFFVPGRAQVSTYVVASFLREGGREIYVMPPVPPVFVERIAQSSHARLSCWTKRPVSIRSPTAMLHGVSCSPASGASSSSGAPIRSPSDAARPRHGRSAIPANG